MDDQYRTAAFVALARALDPFETFTASDGMPAIRGRTRGDLAAAALDALRSLPVKDRMEAMGMEPYEAPSTMVWAEDIDRRLWRETKET